MGITLEDTMALEQLDKELKAILPALYCDFYEDVAPVSMGSAPLKYDADGRVAWDGMWASFCDLAMAGGPPHRGTLLQPSSAENISEALDDHHRVTHEICRGISLVTGLRAAPSHQQGWVEVSCHSVGMAAWLMRAIVMENVSARHEQSTLFLPAGPDFRIEKEIKNVITAVAKTTHYWLEHTPPAQQQSIAATFAAFRESQPLIEPALHAEIVGAPDAYRRVLDTMCDEIGSALHLPCFKGRYAGWAGFECKSVKRAGWMLRAMIVKNILARRENEVLFVPVHPNFETNGQTGRLIRTFSDLHRLAAAAGS